MPWQSGVLPGKRAQPRPHIHSGRCCLGRPRVAVFDEKAIQCSGLRIPLIERFHGQPSGTPGISRQYIYAPGAAPDPSAGTHLANGILGQGSGKRQSRFALLYKSDPGLIGIGGHLLDQLISGFGVSVAKGQRGLATNLRQHGQKLVRLELRIGLQTIGRNAAIMGRSPRERDRPAKAVR